MSQPAYNPMDLSGRRILVTGASAGIGRAIAVLLSRLGAAVVCVGRNPSNLADTLSLLAGENHISQVYDLHDLAGIQPWLQEIAARGGGLHGLVHAAGIQSTLSLKLLNPEKWREVFMVNTEAALSLAQGFQTRQVYAGEKGAIVFISSVMGLVSAPGRTAYSLSKGALDGAMRALALELAPKKIRVNCVTPAFVNTAMYQEMTRVWDEPQRAQVERLHPLGIGEPEDVAQAVAFLLADTGRWITGTTLVVDGGYTAQ
jgi:NAD(P)-dependent dehydrogenase (short-subunit alcohol dehydrogenase family)